MNETNNVRNIVVYQKGEGVPALNPKPYTLNPKP